MPGSFTPITRHKVPSFEVKHFPSRSVSPAASTARVRAHVPWVGASNETAQSGPYLFPFYPPISLMLCYIQIKLHELPLMSEYNPSTTVIRPFVGVAAPHPLLSLFLLFLDVLIVVFLCHLRSSHRNPLLLLLVPYVRRVPVRSS